MINKQLSRLGFLLRQFDITEIELANILHVHYTLVSKWKNRKRVLNPHSPYLKNIIEHFIALDSNIQYKRLKQILSREYPNTSLESVDEISFFLNQWLSERDTDFKKDESLLKIITDKNTYRAEFYIFKENEGRRKASIDFMDIAISSPEGREMLLFSQEDNAWFYKDEKFLKLWRKKNFEFLNKNGKIHIIHTLDRSYKSNAFSLLCWLPLHISPNTFPYLYPKFLESTSIRFTMFLLKNVAAIFGITAEITTKILYTYLLFDPISLSKCQFAIQSLLTSCTPMFEKLFHNDNRKIVNLITKSLKEEEDSYFSTLPPSIAIISGELFRSIMAENNFSNTEIKLYLGYQSAIKNEFHGTLPDNCHRYIYDINKLEQILESGRIFLNESSLFIGKDLKITRDILILCIEEIILDMDKIPNLKIGLSEGPPHPCLENIDIWVKKNTVTIFNTMALKKRPAFSLVTREVTAVNSYFYSFNQIWNSISPIKRDPNWVKQRLLHLISKFKS
ncbi:MAG: hypothetical protein WC549_07215 [Actinomycetota bacterium]